MVTTQNQETTQGPGEGQEVATSADIPLKALRWEMNRLFDDFFRHLGSATPQILTPRVNVSETDKEYEVTAELPGIEAKDIEVSLGQNMLILKGEKRAEREEQQKDYHLRERSFGSFHRTIALPGEIDQEKVSASFKNSVLTVLLPKAQGAQVAAKRIEILPGDPTTPP